jgi:GTPase SAR1 family protein
MMLTPFDKQRDDKQHTFPDKPFNMVFCASKGQGKTTLLLNLITKKESPLYKRYNKIFLISPTAKKDEKMMELVEDIGDDQYYQELTEDNLQEILDKIEYETEMRKQSKKPKPEFLLVLDDVIHMLKGKNGKKLAELITQNRHHSLTNMILVQKWNNYLPTIIRSNLDCIAYWHTQSKKELKSFVEDMNGKEDELMALYEYATNEPYSFLYINQYNPSKPMYFKRFDRIQ